MCNHITMRSVGLVLFSCHQLKVDNYLAIATIIFSFMIISRLGEYTKPHLDTYKLFICLTSGNDHLILCVVKQFSIAFDKYDADKLFSWNSHWINTVLFSLYSTLSCALVQNVPMCPKNSFAAPNYFWISIRNINSIIFRYNHTRS